MARWPSGPRRVTQAKACLSQSGFSSAYAGRGSNPLLVNFFTLLRMDPLLSNKHPHRNRTRMDYKIYLQPVLCTDDYTQMMMAIPAFTSRLGSRPGRQGSP